MITQVFIFCLVTLAAGSPLSSVPTYVRPDKQNQEEKPQPYSFSFESQDEFGTTLMRKEDGDEFGYKRGSYGYTDVNGVSRQVIYIADDKGFRAVVRTNEPGTESQNPADVEMISDAMEYQALSNYEIPSVPEEVSTDNPAADYGRRLQQANGAVPANKQLYIPISSARVIPVSYNNAIANHSAVSLGMGRRY